MLGLFGNHRLGAFVALFFFSILIHLAGFILPGEAFQEELRTQSSFAKELSINYPFWSFVFAYISNVTVAIVLTGFSKKFNLFDSKNLLIPYAFLLFCGCSYYMLRFSEWHLILIGQVLIIYIVFALYEMVKDKAPLNLFVLGFIAGFFILIESTNFLYLLVILWGVILFKPSQKKDIFVFLLGFAVVMFFIFSVYFLQDFDDGIRTFFKSDLEGVNKDLFLPFQPFYLFPFVLIVGVVSVLLNFGRNNIFARKSHKFLLALLIVNAMIAILNGRSMYENAQFFAVLFGVYGGHLLSVNKIKWIPELLNGILLILVLWYQFECYLPIEFQEIPDYLF